MIHYFEQLSLIT